MIHFNKNNFNKNRQQHKEKKNLKLIVKKMIKILIIKIIKTPILK